MYLYSNVCHVPMVKHPALPLLPAGGAQRQGHLLRLGRVHQQVLVQVALGIYSKIRHCGSSLRTTPSRQTMLGCRRSAISSESRWKSPLVAWFAPILRVLTATKVLLPPTIPPSSPLYTFPNTPSPISCTNRTAEMGNSRARTFGSLLDIV